jgi:hypothetical protein
MLEPKNARESKYTNIYLSTLAALLCLGCSVVAAEQSALTDADKAKAFELIKNLGAEEFSVRTKAAEELGKMNAGVVPLLRETLATTPDAEVKIQVAKILKTWTLEHGTDPNTLSKYGRDEAIAKNYAEAVPYYEKAAKLYSAAAAVADADKRKTLEQDAKKAVERSKRASEREKIAKAAAGAQDIELQQSISVEIQSGANAKDIVKRITSDDW